MSDSLPQPEPDEAPPLPEVPAESMPNPPSDAIAAAGETAGETETEVAGEAEETVAPDDPVALANDRAGFKFLAIGFAIFFALIAVCAGIVALVMKSMGI